MDKVLVDRELLERMIQLDSLGLCAQQEYAALRAILAQPAEAEGVEVVAEAYSYPCRYRMQVTVMKIRQIRRLRDGDKLVRQVDHLATLSAVTDERDGWHERAIQVLDKKKEWADRARKAEAEIEHLRAEVEALRVLLIDARELIENGDFREGHCMCGSAVDGHTFGDGHTPCDAGEYYAGQVRERIDAAMAAKEA